MVIVPQGSMDIGAILMAFSLLLHVSHGMVPDNRPIFFMKALIVGESSHIDGVLVYEVMSLVEIIFNVLVAFS